MANREQLQPLVKAAVKRTADRQQARQQELLSHFRKAVRKLLSPQVEAALELSYQWNTVTDQPVAVCAVQGSTGETCEISSLRDVELWSASLASGAVLIQKISNPSVAGGFTWMLIMLMRPLFIATLHEIYEDYRPAQSHFHAPLTRFQRLRREISIRPALPV